jgi:hypothetical protein
MVFATLLSLDLRDSELARSQWATFMKRLDGSNDVRPTRVIGEAIAGYFDVRDGRVDRGLARIERTLDEAHDADHAPGMRSCLVRVLLEACVAAQAIEAGLAAADRALAAGDPARLWEAETRRLRAEFLAALGAAPDEVEAELAQALQVARRQNAKMLELRVAISLFRQRRVRGNSIATRQARELLTGIVNALAGRGDTQDQLEAMALLGR